LDSEDKQFGYIVDYKDLFRKLEDAVAVYTADLDYANFEPRDVDIMLQDRLKVGKERLDNALEEIALLCEPVTPPKSSLDYQHYFCGNTEIPEDLKRTEVQRTALYKNTVALIRAYANIADAMESAGYTATEIKDIKQQSDFYSKLCEEIQQASDETLDLKTHEADMRHLIDTYIQADEPKTISPFGDMSLIDIIVNADIAEAINSLANGIKSSPEAIAETIENNIRKKIIKEHLTDPAFFAEMSKLLAEIIKERQAKAISYKEYLQKIAKLAQQVHAGKSEEPPETLTTPAQRALYNNLNNNADLAIQIDTAVKNSKPADWRGKQPRENVIKTEIYNLLKNQTGDNGFAVKEPQDFYGQDEIRSEVERIFEIIKQQNEY
jgi:type I restriction enzyme R subunit